MLVLVGSRRRNSTNASVDRFPAIFDMHWCWLGLVSETTYLLGMLLHEPSGKILCAHCHCMAGLGECCSHVASLLWAVEAGV